MSFVHKWKNEISIIMYMVIIYRLFTNKSQRHVMHIYTKIPEKKHLNFNKLQTKDVLYLYKPKLNGNEAEYSKTHVLVEL